jgi:hypothetical protein
MMPSLLADSVQSTPSYPREFNDTAGKVQISKPVISDWAELRKLTGTIPLQIDSSQGETWKGTVSFEVATRIHLDERQVSLNSMRLESWNFDRGALPSQLRGLATRALEAGEDRVSLDYVLRSLPVDFQVPGSEKAVPHLNPAPPRIVISNRPMRLMLIDGAPAKEKIDGSELEYVINTDWDVFHHQSSDRWFILTDGLWLTNSMLSSGDWLSTTELPVEFQNLTLNSFWPQVAAAMPPRPPDTPPLPFTISYEPTDLIIIDGDAQLELIPGTVVRYVKNTKSDLFQLADRYYLLVSGRWFMTKDLKRMWYAVKQLPTAFSSIPADHEKSYVRASVPGTDEARIAMIEAAIPRMSEVSLDAGNSIEIPYAGDPSFVAIEGTMLQRAVNTPYQVIRHNNFYYLCHDGAWFSSSQPQGPWRVASEVPEAIYTIPPTDPAYNVTFVRLESFDDSSNRAAFKKTAGYYRIYSNGYSMVHGTGWYYPGYVHTGAYGHNSYWRYPYSYGFGAVYNPYYGRYGYRGNYGYYPHSYSQSSTYSLGNTEKDWTWDVDGNKRRVHDYGPQNYVGSGQYVLPDGTLYQGEQR